MSLTQANPSDLTSWTPCLKPQDVQRVLITLIRAEQDRLKQNGRISSAQHIDSYTFQMALNAGQDIKINEDGLGFDSLARLDLVMSVNRFFGLSETGIEDYLFVQPSLSDWVTLVGHHFDKMADGARFTFSTSGSMGPPKHISHGLAGMLSEVGAHLDGPLRHWSKQQTSNDSGPATPRILCSVPVHHIFGFIWGVLMPAQANVQALDLSAGLPSAVLRTARQNDVVLSTPFGWERLARTGQRLPDGVIGISSGAPTTSQTWQAAQQLGLSQLIEVYGASETAGIGWRINENKPFTTVCDLDRDGEMVMRRAVSDQPMMLQDRLEWVGPDQFHVCGRNDQAVQVGGVNVSLELVRQHLCDCDGVTDAAVRIDADRLKGFIVTDAPDIADVEARLRQHLNTLPAPARPDRFTFGTQLPLSSMGKLQDW